MDEKTLKQGNDLTNKIKQLKAYKRCMLGDMDRYKTTYGQAAFKEHLVKMIKAVIEAHVDIKIEAAEKELKDL